MKTEFFDRHAPQWKCYPDRKDLLKIKKMLALLRRKENSRILDVGCGAGVLNPFLREKAGDKGFVVGLDISLEMLKKARGVFHERFICVRSPAERMPFPKETFDSVVCFCCFPHFNDKQTAISETWRVLKKGGQVLISHLSSRESLNAFHKNIGGAVAEDILPENPATENLLRECGFFHIQFQEEDSSYIISAKKLF